MTVATSMVKMNAQQDKQLLSMIDKGLANGEAMQAAPPPGMGQTLDMVV